MAAPAGMNPLMARRMMMMRQQQRYRPGMGRMQPRPMQPQPGIPPNPGGGGGGWQDPQPPPGPAQVEGDPYGMPPAGPAQVGGGGDAYLAQDGMGSDDPTGGGTGGGVGTGGGGSSPYAPSPRGMSMYQPGNSPGGNPFNDRDVYNQFQNLGKNAYQQGQDWENEFGNQSNYYRGQQGQASDRVNSLYDPIWGGGGGYTQEQMGNVLQQGGLNDIQGQLGDNQLYDYEKNQIKGDPYKAFGLFQGQAPELTSLAAKTNNSARDRVREGQGRADQALGGMASDYNAAIDPASMSLSGDYLPGIRGTLSQGRSEVGRAQGDPGLNTTADYARQAGMSDQEVSDTATMAGQDVGARYGADRDEVLRAAQASGNGSAGSIGAVLSDLDRRSAADRTDAVTRARLGARQQQRDAATGVQGMQLGAGQYRAGLGSQNALALQNSDIAANTTAEQMRLAAEQAKAGTRLGAATNLANARLASNANLTGLGANTELQGGQMELGTGMYNANMATGLVGQAEQQDQARAASIAQNRQGTNQYNQGIGLGINNTLANRYQAAYAPWLANQQEGRQAATGQQGFYANQGNTADTQRLAGQALSQQGQLGAGSGYSGWGAGGGKGFGDFFSSAFGSSLGKSLGSGFGFAGAAHGGVIDQNQLIEVGEGNRPEAILPLMPTTPRDKRNPWEQMGAELGRKLGLPGGNAYRANLSQQEMETNPEDVDHYDQGGVAPSFWQKALGAGLSMTPARSLAPMATGGKFDYRSMMPAGVRQFMPNRKPVNEGPQMSTGPVDTYSPDQWNAGGDAGYDEGEDQYDGYARGGIPGLNLNSNPSINLSLKHLLNKSKYRMNMGRHNTGTPLPYSEMGMLTHA